MRGHGRSGLGFLISLAALVLAGCNVNSPTEPTAFTPSSSISGSLTGEAVVSGQLVQGSSALSSESFAATASGLGNIRVSVVGTPVTDTTDSAGRFRLANTPEGNLQLRFVGGNLNAQLALQGVTEALAITVQVQGSSVQLVGTTPSLLERFNELALAVTVINPIAGEGTLALERGDTAAVDGTTMWDPKGDYFNLVDVETALASGVAIKVKGQGTRDSATGMILVSRIRAKIIAQGAEFDGPVASASGTDPNGTILLVSNSKGSVLQVNVDGATVWDPNGDLTSFADLLAAFTKGLLINVEGKGALDATGTFILAGEIKAELEERDFEGIVSSASGSDPDGAIILVSNDKGPITTILVDADTVWEGDVSSLTELIAAIAGPFPVKVEGEGWLAADETFILATRIKVEIEDEDNVCDDRYATQVAAIDDLIDLVEDVAEANGLNSGQTNAFVSKLENAAKSLERCNATPAANQLGAFINEVNAFVGSGKLPAADGVLLVSAARAIIDAINAVG